jgi:hypothetical protein
MKMDLYVLTAGSALTGLIFYYFSSITHFILHNDSIDIMHVDSLDILRRSMVIMASVGNTNLYTCIRYFLVTQYNQTFCT